MSLGRATGRQIEGLQEMEAEGETPSKSTIEEYSALIKKGKSEELSRREGNNGICYMADKGCEGARDPNRFNNFCWDRGEDCDLYVERRKCK